MKRRDVLKGLPVAAVAVALPTTSFPAAPAVVGGSQRTADAPEVCHGLRSSGYSESDMAEIERLIERHQTAWLEFELSCPSADESDCRFGGQEAIDRNEALEAGEQEALLALMRAPVATRWASNRKATYLLTTIGPYGRWEPDFENVVSLLRSLLWWEVVHD